MRALSANQRKVSQRASMSPTGTEPTTRDGDAQRMRHRGHLDRPATQATCQLLPLGILHYPLSSNQVFAGERLSARGTSVGWRNSRPGTKGR